MMAALREPDTGKHPRTLHGLAPEVEKQRITDSIGVLTICARQARFYRPRPYGAFNQKVHTSCRHDEHTGSLAGQVADRGTASHGDLPCEKI